MSRKAGVPINLYKDGFRNPRAGFPPFWRASLIRAQKPAQTGALQLVPPIPIELPPKTSNAPVFGSAAAHTSGTSRFVPPGIPLPTCQAGRGKNRLTPPPLAVQPVSDVTAPVASRRR